jgi:hypothetical protein
MATKQKTAPTETSNDTNPDGVITDHGVELLFTRSYWPKSDSAFTRDEDGDVVEIARVGEAEELRILENTVAFLPAEEAIDAIELGVAKRVRR